MNRSGILAHGAGLVKVGEGGQGLAQRPYPQTLAGRISVLPAHRHRVRVTRGDAPEILERTRFRAGTVLSWTRRTPPVRTAPGDAGTPLTRGCSRPVRTSPSPG